ncbi:MAG TPA: hypothetical protein GX700_10950, partial [Paracoccus sp.]|nr:hypothetical protein [Paracoccus sp. (in: a-proteobacteria)]
GGIDQVAVIERVSGADGDTLTLAQRIPVGYLDADGRPLGRGAGPTAVATLASANLAFVTLQDAGGVAVVDLVSGTQVNIGGRPAMDDDPGTTGFIRLDGLSGGGRADGASSARPFDLTLDRSNNYLLVSDSASNRIFVIDIQQGSASQYTVVETIRVAPGAFNLREIALTPDGRQLVVAATTSAGGPDQGRGQIAIYNMPDFSGFGSERVPGTLGPAVFARQVILGVALQQPYGVETAIGPVDGLTYAFITDKSSDVAGVTVLRREGGVWTEASVIPFNLSDPTALANPVLTPARTASVLRDGLEVNDAAGIVLSPDLRYAFVMGQNRFVPGDVTRDPNYTPGFFDLTPPQGVYRAGSGIAVISDPFGSDARVIGMLRPVANSFGLDLAVSGDGLTLIGAYGARGAFFGYDVTALTQVIESYRANSSVGQFSMVEFALNDLRNIAPAMTSAPALVLRSFEDRTGSQRLGVNLEVDIAADLAIWNDEGAFIERPSDPASPSQNAPVGTGGIARSVESQAPFLTLLSPSQAGGPVESTNPTFVWDLGGQVRETTLFISVAGPGNGLFPEDSSPALIQSLIDMGFQGMSQEDLAAFGNRLVTLDGNRNRIYMRNFEAPADGGQVSFTLPGELKLTRGQTYFWGVAVNDGDQRLYKLSESFRVAPERGETGFSNITVVTHDMSIWFDGGPTDSATFELAREIATRNDAVLAVHDQRTGQFLSITPGREVVADGRPLVLLMDWSVESSINDSGFSEAAADGMFASLVALNMATGGAVFRSDMHFIGHGRGAVVNSEIVQRMFHHFPETKGTQDIHFTTLDPVDHENPQLKLPISGFLGNLAWAAKTGSFISAVGAVAAAGSGVAVPTVAFLGNASVRLKAIADRIDDIAKAANLLGVGTLDWTGFKDPEIRIWDGIDFADNYYQKVRQPISLRDALATATASTIKSTTGIGTGALFSPTSEEVSLTMLGRALAEADLNVNLTGLPGFIEDDFAPDIDLGLLGNLGVGWGTAHNRVVAYYAGTAALNRATFGAPGTSGDPILRSLADLGVEGPQIIGGVLSRYYNDSFPLELNRQGWYRGFADEHGQTPFGTVTGVLYAAATGPGVDASPWEGLGLGWYFSDLGGGASDRRVAEGVVRPDA